MMVEVNSFDCWLIREIIERELSTVFPGQQTSQREIFETSFVLGKDYLFENTFGS